MEIEIAAILTKLALHYWRPDFSPTQARHLLDDFLTDLSGFTPAQIGSACALYRRNGENRFFPTPGQLLELLRPPPREVRYSLPTYEQPKELEAPRTGKLKSVGQILRDAGHIRAADSWEARAEGR